jgi:hypothetical protein
MVDFQNPVFSPKRSSLLQYATKVPTGTIQNGASDVPAQLAGLIAQAAAGQPPCDPTTLDACTAEQQFLFYWGLPDDRWRSAIAAAVTAYLNGVGQRSATPQGAGDYLALAASRAVQFKSQPEISNLDEFSLLLPQTDLPPSPVLRMHPDGTVGQ